MEPIEFEGEIAMQTRIRISFAIMLILLILAAGVPTFAQGPGFVDEIDFIEWVPCANNGAGEPVHLTGRLHNVFTDNIAQVNPQGVEGVGLITGDMYRGTGMFHETSVHTDGAWSFSYIDNYRIIGTGTNNDLILHGTFHFTVNAKGDITSYVDEFSVECR